MQQPLALKLLPGGPRLPPTPFQPLSKGLIFQQGLPLRRPVSPDPWSPDPPLSHQTPTWCQALGLQK